MLSSKELALLLQGSEGFKDAEESNGFKLIEGLAGMFAHRRIALALVLLFFAVLPLLGGRYFWETYGGVVAWAVWLLTAIAGGYLVWRYAGKSLGEVVGAFRRGEPPTFPVMLQLVRAVAGFLLLMPGPVVNILACVLLLPPCSRLAALLLGRHLGRIIE